MLSNSQRNHPKFAVLLSLLVAGLCLSITSHASTLEAWRSDIASTRLLIENDVSRALTEVQRLQANIPPEATLVDKARVLNLLSSAESHAALVEQSAQHAKLAFELASQNGDKVGQVEADLNVAWNAVNQSRIDEVAAAAVHAMTMLEGVDRPDLLSEAMLRTSMTYRRLGQFDDSTTMSLRQMEIAKRSSSPRALMFALQGLAISYAQSGDEEKAHEYFLLMLEQARAIPSKMFEAEALIGAGEAEMKLGRVEKGENMIRAALALDRAVGAPFQTAHAAFSLAFELHVHHRDVEALRLTNETVMIFGRYNNMIGLWWSLNERSVIWQESGHLAAAQADAERSYALAKKINLAIYVSGSAQRLSAMAATRGNYRQAWQYAQEAAEVKAKTDAEDSRSRMLELAKRYEADSKQRQIAELTLHNEQQDNFQRWLWTLLGGSIALFSITLFFLMRFRRSRHEIRKLNIGLEQRVQERTAELRQQARYLRTLIDMLPMWAWFKDTQNRYLAINQAAAQAYGHTAEEMLGKSDLDMLPAEIARNHELDDIGVMTSRQRKITEAALENETEQSWMETYKVAVLDEDGSLLGTVGVARDISERKATEVAREAALVEAKRLARSRSEFLAQMSHELRTPLNGILGYAQILARDKKLSERQIAGVRVIQHSGEHLLTLINDILDFSKIDAGKMELIMSEIPLDSFLHTIAGIVRVKADQKRLEFVTSFAPDLPAWILSDEKRLRQVLLNLLSNAIKFTERGRVSLRVDSIRPGHLRFEVIDTGISIPAEQLEIIFQPFEQVAQKRHQFGGTGLGLPISREFVRMMGSDICVESKPGQGSTFWFELDVVVDHADADTAPERVVSGYAGPRKTILVVDDIQPNRDIVVEMLTRLGFAMIEAVDGSDGLSKAQAQHPDLILMDTIMPVMDGLEATRRLRRIPECENIPIITISASASNEDESRSQAAGANAFISKPLAMMRLLAQIGRLLNLDWRYESTAASVEASLVVPLKQEIEILHHLALSGNMHDILQHADHLIEMDERYRPFAEQLRSLALGYKTKAILSFIEQHLERKVEA